MNEVNFADLVRRLRRVRQQTQEEFARDLDVTVGTVNGWENSKHRPVRAQRRRLVDMAEQERIAVDGRLAPPAA